MRIVGGRERDAKFPYILFLTRGRRCHVESSMSRGRAVSSGETGGASISRRVYPEASNENPSDAVRNSKFGCPCKWRREHFFRFSRGCLMTVTLTFIAFFFSPMRASVENFQPDAADRAPVWGNKFLLEEKSFLMLKLCSFIYLWTTIL